MCVNVREGLHACMMTSLLPIPLQIWNQPSAIVIFNNPNRPTLPYPSACPAWRRKGMHVLLLLLDLIVVLVFLRPRAYIYIHTYTHTHRSQLKLIEPIHNATRPTSTTTPSMKRRRPAQRATGAGELLVSVVVGAACVCVSF